MLLSEAFEIFEVDCLVGKKKPKTIKNYQSSYNSLLDSFGDLPMEFLTYNSVIEWKRKMEYRGMQLSSIQSSLGHLRAILKYLKKHGVSVFEYSEIELATIKSHPTWLNVDEVRAFLGVIENPRDKAIFSCLFSSAARISELLQLNRDSIVDGRAEIIGKGDKPGVIFFDSGALKALDDYLLTRKDKLRPLFVSGQYRRITVSRVEQLAHIYADMAGIDKNVTPHVFRHSRATDIKRNGADIYDLQKILRHASISTTQIYTHLDDQVGENIKKYGSPTPI